MIPAPFSFREPPCLSPFHGRSFFCHHTKKEQKKKSPSANPHSTRPVVRQKQLPRLQLFLSHLLWQRQGFPFTPRGGGAHSICICSSAGKKRATGTGEMSGDTLLENNHEAHGTPGCYVRSTVLRGRYRGVGGRG